MKKTVYLLLMFLIACSNKNNAEKKTTSTDSVQSKKNVDTNIDTQPDSILIEYSANVINAIKNNDVEKMAGYIHPIEGIRFTPYGYVDTVDNIKLSVDAFKNQWTKNSAKKLTWGEFDGVGKSIELTIKEYFNQFVYDRDYKNAPFISTSINNNSHGRNVQEIYNDCKIVEYHFPESKAEKQDWKTLWLVYKKNADKYLLVAVVHDEWTI